MEEILKNGPVQAIFKVLALLYLIIFIITIYSNELY